MQDKRLMLGRLEAAVLNVLWASGDTDSGCTVQQVLDGLPRGRERHYNTCSTVLTRLVKRKLVARSAKDRVHTFRALVTRDEMGRAYLESVRRDVFGGSLRGLVAALVDPRDSKSADVAEVRALLAEIERAEAKSVHEAKGNAGRRRDG
ncbi:MAG: BlaI/MecI/CopY family transcriptional regulator [Planctomycetes bacterium]|nr:BlaI/MecI/CopY family transcriptional regulator [Planctomycetota bacterium]